MAIHTPTAPIHLVVVSDQKRAKARMPPRSQHLVIWLGLIPLLIAIAAYRTSSQHVASVAATLSTDDLIRKLDELLSAMQDAETGQRGYLLTGDRRYLIPFTTAAAAIQSKLDDVAARTARNKVPAELQRQL